MIYGRTGDPVTVVRRAVLADVAKLDGRHHQAFLRADGGSREIADAIEGVERQEEP